MDQDPALFYTGTGSDYQGYDKKYAFSTNFFVTYYSTGTGAGTCRK